MFQRGHKLHAIISGVEKETSFPITLGNTLLRCQSISHLHTFRNDDTVYLNFWNTRNIMHFIAILVLNSSLRQFVNSTPVYFLCINLVPHFGKKVSTALAGISRNYKSINT